MVCFRYIMVLTLYKGGGGDDDDDDDDNHRQCYHLIINAFEIDEIICRNDALTQRRKSKQL